MSRTRLPACSLSRAPRLGVLRRLRRGLDRSRTRMARPAGDPSVESIHSPCPPRRHDGRWAARNRLGGLGLGRPTLPRRMMLGRGVSSCCSRRGGPNRIPLPPAAPDVPKGGGARSKRRPPQAGKGRGHHESALRTAGRAIDTAATAALWVRGERLTHPIGVVREGS